MKLALQTSKLSKDPATRVGAILATSDNTQCALGYNGFVRGIVETKEKWERPIKYEFVRHAEENCIIFSPISKSLHSECTMYCTHQPCHRCLGLIVQSGIKRVLYIQAYANLTFREIWEEHASLLKEIRQIDVNLP